ncbi:MAG: hypothetical protein ACLUAR_17825 [Pilosibacter sp.]
MRIILLLDDRFLKREYLELFPERVGTFSDGEPETWDSSMEEFWESRK